VAVPLSELAGGWIEAVDQGATMAVATRLGSVIAVRLESRARAEALLEKLGQSPRQRAVSIRLGTQPPTDFGWTELSSLVALAALGAGTVIGNIVLAVVLCCLGAVGLTAPLLVGATGPHVLIIGSDGLVLRSRRRRRYLAYSSIRAVVADGPRIRIERQGSAGVVSAWTSGREESEAIAERIKETMNASSARPASPPRNGVERDGRPFREWRDALRELASRSTGYRDADGPRKELLEIVDDERAPIERRAAAVMALSADADTHVKAKLRVAADVCADDRMRRALEAAAEDALDDELLADAIRAQRGN
jgi:hypothetical protein